MKLYDTTLYVAKSGNLFSIGSEEGARSVRRKLKSEDKTRGQRAYLTY